MGKYYYFVAQLPFLQFDKEPSITRATFLKEAKKWLSKEDFKQLVKTNIDSFAIDVDDSEILKAYKKFENTLREEIALVRRTSKKNIDFKALEIIDSSLLEVNPLEAERKLFKLRWGFIESQEKDHFFDLGLIILYFLKLQILEHLFTFDKEKGLEVFDSLCEVQK